MNTGCFRLEFFFRAKQLFHACFGISESNVQNAIAAIKKVSPKIVALSPHDSSDWSLDQFRQAFGNAYVDIQVGKEIVI